jgi:hypothetical protein
MNKPLGIGAGLLAIIASSGFAQNTTPNGQPLFWKNITDNTQYVGKTCVDYNSGYFNAITGDIVRCTRSSGFTAGLTGNYITVSGGGGGGSAWGGITGTLSNQTDLQTALNAKQSTLTLPLSVANGGTGTTTPNIVAGSGISVSGTWPNQTVTNTGGGGGGIASGTALPGTCTTGSAFIKTNGAPDQQFYICSTTNTWTQNLLLGGSGALGIDGTTGALDIVTSVVPRTSAANFFSGRNSYTLSDYVQQGAPSAPAAGKLTLYANNDGSLHYINSSGTDAALATGAGFANPMTTQDDVITGGASGAPTRLAKGADSQVLGIDPGTHHLTYINQTGGGTPAGSDGDFQINSSGSFGAGPIKYAANYISYPRIAIGDTTAFPDFSFAKIKTSVPSVTLELENTNATGYTQTALQGGRYIQIGVGNASETGLNVAGKWFVYDGGTNPTAGDGKGLMIVADPTTTIPTVNMFGALRNVPTSTDPGCAGAGDSGKQWMDNTDTNTHHFKVCSITGGTAAWVTVF